MIYKTKLIIFIPPNGILKKHDFSLERIVRSLKDDKLIKSILIYKENHQDKRALKYFDNIIQIKSEKELFKKISHIDYDIIFSRSWMHAYSFSAKLVKKFDNVVVNIKDWNFSTKKEYKFLFKNNDDFNAIKYIFKNAKYILSHYTKEQAKIWSKKYNVNKDKFIFFPEFCNKENFINNKIFYSDTIKIVYAGQIKPSNSTEKLFPAKSHLRSIDILSKQGINIDFVLPESNYNYVIKNQKSFEDFLYEKEFNNKFNLKKGKNIDASVLNQYHFGFFEIETSGKNKELYNYAIVSKFALYLEAGLPMLVNKDFKSISSIVMNNKLGIVFSNNDIQNLSKLLSISNKRYKDFIKNIEQYRVDFSYKNQIKDILNG